MSGVATFHRDATMTTSRFLHICPAAVRNRRVVAGELVRVAPFRQDVEGFTVSGFAAGLAKKKSNKSQAQ
jgi:hypothetical protein